MSLLPVLNAEYNNSIGSIKSEKDKYPVLHYRPYKVGEEKMLLMASESEDKLSVFKAIAKTINECVKEDVDSINWYLSDIEYFFINLRNVSVGETAEIRNKCIKCGNEEDITLDLSNVYISDNNNNNNIIDIKDKEYNIKLELDNLRLSDIIKNKFLINDNNNNNSSDKIFKIIDIIIKNVIIDEDVIEFSNETKSEREKFINSMSDKTFKDIINFINNTPTTEFNHEYSCSECREVNTINITGLSDFFELDLVTTH